VPLFVPCLPPREGFEALTSEWYEWSPDARRHFVAMQPYVTPQIAPVAVNRPDHPYGWAYELPEPPEEGSPLWEHVEALSHHFYELRLPSGGIAFLCRLFDHGVESHVVRFLLAALPRHMPRRHPKASALNIPIQPFEPAGSAFPLHADLFLQSNLLTVFHEIPAEETGHSVFLTTAALLRVLGETSSVPPEIATKIRFFFDDRAGDHFDELVDLLYHPRHPWCLDIRRQLRALQHRALFQGGEGYVLDDRRWLHGRERLRYPVATSRLCRIVFDSASALEGA
jgi:hypothetical protein